MELFEKPKKLLVDLRNLMLIQALGNNTLESYKKLPLTQENVVRFFVRSILKYKKEFPQYTDVYIVAEGGNVWRKQIFPYYKIKRQAQSIDFDFHKFNDYYNVLLADIAAFLSYTLVKIDGAEADDCIASIVRQSTEECLILSADRDFKQLQIYPHCKQYSIRNREYLVESDPIQFLREKIVTGDSGDSVPNVLSPDDVFITAGKRQTRMTAGRLADILAGDTTEEVKQRLERNKILMDLTTDHSGFVDAKIEHILENIAPKKFGGFRRLLNKYGLIEYYDSLDYA